MGVEHGWINLVVMSVSSLARVPGTEEDRINCPFFTKIGACRHAGLCTRKHQKLAFSQTILLRNMYYNPLIPHVNSGHSAMAMDALTMQQAYDDFLEEIVEELSRYGKLEDVQIVENLGDHMIGNVYAKYEDEEDAEKALKTLDGRFFAGRVLQAEYSPVTDFSEARCRQFDEDVCDRGPFCNFMHVRSPCNALRKYLKEKYNFDGLRMKGSATVRNFS